MAIRDTNSLYILHHLLSRYTNTKKKYFEIFRCFCVSYYPIHMHVKISYHRLRSSAVENAAVTLKPLE